MTPMKSRRPLLLPIFCLLVAFCNQVKAQDFNDDAAVWINFYFEKKLGNHVDLHLNQQDRFNDNVRLFGMGYTDWGITYHFNRSFKIMSDYVFVQRRNLDGSYSTRHQFYAALVYKKRFGRYEFLYRNMFQSQIKDVYSSKDGRVPVYYERNKFTLKYELTKRLQPYVAQELYYPLYQAKNKGFDRSRSFIGMFYKVNRRTTLELYGLYQYQLNAFNKTNRDYIYGLGYAYEF